LSRLFRALQSRNYRLFFGGELISMVGSWMQSIVQAWLVYRLSHSALWLGIIAFCSQFSAFLISPLAGVMADDLDRRKLLIWVELAGMAQAFLLAALFFTGRIELWHIAVLSVILGICNSFEIITRHAFAVDLVGKADLTSAISLNSIVINGSRIVGPALAGILIAFVNEGWCFVLNGVSYLAVIYSLIAMDLSHVNRRATGTPKVPFWPNFRAAIQYLRGLPAIRRLLMLSTFISFVGFPSGNLMPVFASDVLHGTATTLAWLTGTAGIGGISGALILGNLSSNPKHGGDKSAIRPILTGCLLLMGAGLMIIGLSRTLGVTLAGCLFLGFFMIGAMPMINTRIQHLVDDTMRGRVLSVYTMTFLGATPLGSLMQGWAADRWGAGAVAQVAGAAFVLLALGLIFDARNRRNRRRLPSGPEQRFQQQTSAS
jgi:MFS family permease